MSITAFTMNCGVLDGLGGLGSPALLCGLLLCKPLLLGLSGSLRCLSSFALLLSLPGVLGVLGVLGFLGVSVGRVGGALGVLVVLGVLGVLLLEVLGLTLLSLPPLLFLLLSLPLSSA